jgi:hypothetical protein
MVTHSRLSTIGVLLTLFARCAEYEALPRDYQPQQQQQVWAQAATAMAANDDAQCRSYEGSTRNPSLCPMLNEPE